MMRKFVHQNSKALKTGINICLLLLLVFFPSCSKEKIDMLAQQSSEIQKGEISIPELLDEYQLKIKNNPQDPSNYTLAAAAYHRSESEDLFKKALELSPGYVLALTGLGNYYMRQERYNEALEQYKEAISHSPQNSEIKKKAIQAAIFSNDQIEALRLAENSKELKIEYVHGLIDQGKMDIAEKALEDFGFATENTAEVLAARGRLFYEKGQEEKNGRYSDEGIELLLESWEKSPGLPLFYQYVYPRKTLVQILAQNSRKKELETVITTGIRLFPRHYQLYEELWKSEFSDPLSDFDALRKNLIEEIDVLLAKNPPDPELYKTAALGYRMADNPEKTEELNKKILSEFPYSMASQNLRRSEAIKEMDLEKRLELQRRFVKDFPAWPYMYTNIFETLTELNVPDEELLKGAEEFIEHIPYEHAVLKIGEEFLKRNIYIEKVENWLSRFIDDSGVVKNSWEARLLTLKGYLLIRDNEYQRAENLLSQILDVNFLGFSNVDKAKLRECLGHILEADNRQEEALEYYAQAFAQSQHYLKDAGQNFERLYLSVKKSREGMDTYLSDLEKKYQSESEVGVGIERGTEINKPAPEFELVSMEGEKVSLSSLRGKLVIMNFWATYCGPCIKELPHLQKFFKTVEDEPSISVITINCDKNPALAEPFIRKNNYTFPVLYADADLRENYGVRGIPTTFIIDASGEIKLRMVGFNPEEPLIPYLESLVQKYSK
jgi:thiol-disulfide isomerase/thioredoxin